MIRILYPFSTSDGTSIPLDILRPLGTIRFVFSDGIATAQKDLGVAVPILVLRTTEDCFIAFGASAVIPTDASVIANQLFLPADETIIVAPHSPSISVIGDGFAGVLTVQLIDQWGGTGHEAALQAI
jgi:hypothetical protein